MDSSKFKIGSPEKPLKTEQRDRESLSDRVTGCLKPSVQQRTPILSQMPEVTYGRLCILSEETHAGFLSLGLWSSYTDALLATQGKYHCNEWSVHTELLCCRARTTLPNIAPFCKLHIWKLEIITSGFVLLMKSLLMKSNMFSYTLWLMLFFPRKNCPFTPSRSIGIFIVIIIPFYWK